jgi:hypothetical protein
MCGAGSGQRVPAAEVTAGFQQDVKKTCRLDEAARERVVFSHMSHEGATFVMA